MEYAYCPICCTDRPLKKDGTFRKHRNTTKFKYDFRYGFPTCKGSGMKAEVEPKP